MLEYLKNYYIIMLVLMIVSYLVPKEEYKGYIQFFISIFIVVLLIMPIMEFITMEDPAYIYSFFEELNQQMEEGLGEYSVFEGEGE